MKPETNIVLIGMPGVGKSTVGVLLAKRLGYSFLDTDIYIQTLEGNTLQELIQQHGTAGFCDIEEDYICSISVTAHVIATGGSVVYRKQAMKHLRANGSIVHLDLELPRLQKRLDDINARGVVITSDQNLEDLYEERQLLYHKYADMNVRTDGLTPAQVVKKVVDLIRLRRTRV
ncbi:MAG: shikimate kinase [Deltaproteobacteria bacterium]|nr:shikimate kinase [Deltaproteobacteria bacterium]